MGIEQDIREIKESIASLIVQEAVMERQIKDINEKVHKLLKQQHEGILWETKGKDQKIKESLKADKIDLGNREVSINGIGL